MNNQYIRPQEESRIVKKAKGLFLGLIVLFLFPPVAPGQTVFLASKALGLISRVADQAHGHETASVLLEADATKGDVSIERGRKNFRRLSNTILLLEKRCGAAGPLP